MRGAIPPLANTLSWRGAQFKKAQGRVYLYLYFYIYLYTKRIKGDYK